MELGQLVRQTAAFDRSKVEVVTGARCAAGIALALAAGLATGHPAGGAFVAGGALLTAFAIFQPGYRRRARIMIAADAWITATTLLGGFAGHWSWVIVALTGLLAMGSGLLVALGPNLAMIGMLGTAEFLFASSEPVGTAATLTHAALIGGGGLLETLVVAGPWPHRPLRPERRALAAAYQDLSRYAAEIPVGHVVLPRPDTTEEIRRTLASAPRRARWGRGRVIQALGDQALGIRESLGALAVARHRLVASRRGSHGGRVAPDDERGADHRSAADTRTRRDDPAAALDRVTRSAAVVLQSLASSIRDDEPPPSPVAPYDRIGAAEATLRRRAGAPGIDSLSSWERAMQDHDLDLVLALHGQLRSAGRIVTAGIATAAPPASGPPALPSALDRLRGRVAVLRANLTLQSTAFRHAVRLAIAATVATSLYRTLPGSHDYWMPVAALLVLKPDFGTTFTRGLGRAAGTVTGSVLATLIAAELRPGPVVLVILATVIAVGVFAVYRTNYGLYAVGLTALVVFLAAFGGLPPVAAATDRAVDNLVGIALALSIFRLWPTWAATEVPALLGRVLITQAAFCRLTLDGYVDPARLDRQSLEQAASDARLKRTNAEAAVERMTTEPTGPGRLTTEIADGIVAAVHRFGLAAMALHVNEGTQDRPMVALIALRDAITTMMTSLCCALTGRAIDPLPDLRRLHVDLVEQLSPAHTAVGDPPLRTDVAVVLAETDFMVDAVETMARLIAPATRTEPRVDPPVASLRDAIAEEPG